MQYFIGDYAFALSQMPLSLTQDDMMASFACEASETIPTVFQAVPLDVSMLSDFKVLKHTGGYELLQTPRGLFLMNHWCQCRFAYGICFDELSEPTTPVYINPEIRKELPLPVSYLLGTVGLHRKLLAQDAMVVHASYIEFNGRAILFLGPSGTGKSTQARLWNEHLGAPILNGDRVLLRQKNGLWHAYGYPCCGSSYICENRTLPLGAIVVLQQAPENAVCKLSAAQKIRAIVAGTELYPWDEWEISKVFSLAEALVCQVPTVQLSCRADAEAVEVLRNYLENNL